MSGVMKKQTNFVVFAYEGSNSEICLFQRTTFDMKFQAKKRWTAASPDPNMIEVVWKDLDAIISSKPVPKTVEELKETAGQAWAELPQATIDAHIRNFPKRVAAVRKAGGDVD